jgi:hypothetical protein
MNYRERAEQLACCRKEKCRAAIERALREAAAEALALYADRVHDGSFVKALLLEAQRIREGGDE